MLRIVDRKGTVSEPGIGDYVGLFGFAPLYRVLPYVFLRTNQLDGIETPAEMAY